MKTAEVVRVILPSEVYQTNDQCYTVIKTERGDLIYRGKRKGEIKVDYFCSIEWFKIC